MISGNNINGHRFHTLTIAIHFILLALFSMTFTHPFYLSALLLTSIFGIVIAGKSEKLYPYVIIALSMTLFITLINALVSKTGNTDLLSFKLPYLGSHSVKAEAVLYGLNMGLKLSVILFVFCYFESSVNFDKSMSFFSKYAPKSSLIAILTSLMIPRMRRRLASISSVMTMRGAELKSKNPVKSLKYGYPIVKILLLSSLEDSMDTSEALYARGFGLGPRSSYIKEKFHFADFLEISFLLISIFGFGFVVLNNRGFYNFYTDNDLSLAGIDLILLVWFSLGFISFLFLAKKHK